MRLLGILLLLFIAVPAMIVGLATLGTPRPCVDRDTGVAGSASIDLAALARQAAAGGTPTLTITEAQGTAMLRRALADGEVTVTDARLLFCPDGHVEALGTVTVSGWSFDALVEGEVDPVAAPPAVEARALRLGALPGGFTSWMLSVMPGGARRELPLPAGARLRIEDGRAVLTGGLTR